MKEVSLISLYQYLSFNSSIDLQDAIAKNATPAICSIEDVKSAIKNYMDGTIEEHQLVTWANNVLNSNLYAFSHLNPKRYQVMTRTLQNIILYHDSMNTEKAEYLLECLTKCE